MRFAARLLSDSTRLISMPATKAALGVHNESLSAELQLHQRKQQLKEKIARMDADYPREVTPFTDTFGRPHTYLRMSLTERCNLRCLYCMPEEGVLLQPKPNLLTAEEINRIIRIFAKRGVDKLRLTGGEPTIRADLKDIIRDAKSVKGIHQIGITTNGIAVASKLAALKEAGLDMLNVSLDTLDAEKFTAITRRNGFKQVMKTLDKAEELYEFVKINTVLMKNVNDVEIEKFIEMTRKRKLSIRFIEFMPFGGNRFTRNKFVSYADMLDRVKSVYGSDLIALQNTPNDTNKAYKIKGFVGEFGFITSMTNHFCGTCNRVRITADGNLKDVKVCLHGNAEVSLRDALRKNASDREMDELIEAAIKRKKKQHAGKWHRKPPKYEESTDDSYRRLDRKYISNLNGTADFSSHKGTSPFVHKYSRNCSLSLTLSTYPHPYPYSLRPSSTSLQQLRLAHSTSDCDSEKHFTHISKDGSAIQVDVSHKIETKRTAIAQSCIQVTKEVIRQIKKNELKKGDLLSVVRLAGIMGAKQTSSLIPLCHQLLLTNATVNIQIHEDTSMITITCQVSTVGKTGVEMEALMGASIAALTVYDMCKAVTQDMAILHTRLLSKTGGKRDF